ncbi:ATP-binding protein [Phototrophicus methaneseepsis]|uniref:ATP-binding protein n=1 Tax=Phototrophicus methaneseepsis TaxID=2710758 RepID=A0A7S8EDG5_9CHLR|nr:ATP-binding protein [Phototrophicus methaneseepsis]QPC84950.1 ATP-binding protein [Phototrophicus methaneseepsis]
MQEPIILPASLEAVSKFTQGLEKDLQILPIEVRTTFVLAVQELLVNIVQHAYDGMPGRIEFLMKQSASEIVLTVKDYANNAFNVPDTIEAPDPLSLPENGMGMFIIYQSFDEVIYQHVEDGNYWQLTKSLGA